MLAHRFKAKKPAIGYSIHHFQGLFCIGIFPRFTRAPHLMTRSSHVVRRSLSTESCPAAAIPLSDRYRSNHEKNGPRPDEEALSERFAGRPALSPETAWSLVLALASPRKPWVSACTAPHAHPANTDSADVLQ